jgi:miniconductance mechanosensitive channel
MYAKLLEMFTSLGYSDFYSDLLGKTALITAVVLLSFIVNFATKKILLTVITRIVKKTSTKWDDTLVQKGLFDRLAHIAPILVLYYSIPLIFQDSPAISNLTERLIIAILIVIILTVFSSLITAVNDIYSSYKISKNRPIKGYLQIVRVFISILGIVLVITTILDKSALGLLSGIGAFSAVLMLIFKDSILGLVASIQLSGNDMIRIGDWVSVPDFGADGDVVDIKLQTVTIQNFDKTLVNVPIYSLISSSFKNWRGMSDSGGRRIKRHLNIDMNSIKFCSAQMINRFKEIDILSEYIAKKEREIETDNIRKKINTSQKINGRRMTNLGVFRAYIAAYLRKHPLIDDEGMIFLVRQLQSTEKGIPLEIYVFSSDQIWANYENIQADIFDHLLASISFFELDVYQSVSGRDIREFVKK